MVERHQVAPGCRSEMISLHKLLHMQHEEDWMAFLQSLEARRNMSSFDSLLILKSLAPSVVSTQALRNLVQLFLRKVSALMLEFSLSKNEKLAKQALNIVKDFWSVFSNQHVVITKQAFGRYSPDFYEVLPSLASVYVDLFITVHSAKNTSDKASKRLYSWLMFELNERCIKTALLEACQCTKAGATFLLPILRKLLSEPPDNTSNLDYLLHLILLKRWAFVCVELHDLLQASLTIKAPRNFLEWIIQYWPKAREHLPSDKSLKGRRISELLLDLDQQGVEELIDIFSQCLWSAEQVFGKRIKQVDENTEQEMVAELFTIDKKGNDRGEVRSAEEIQPSKKKRKLWLDETHWSNSTSLADEDIDHSQSGNESDIFMLSGLLDDSTSLETNDIKIGTNALGNVNEDKYVSDSIDEISEEEIEWQDKEYEENFTWGNITDKGGFTKINIRDEMHIQDYDNRNISKVGKETDNSKLNRKTNKVSLKINKVDIETRQNLTDYQRKDAQLAIIEKQPTLCLSLSSQSYVVSSSDSENDISSSTNSPAHSSYTASLSLQNAKAKSLKTVQVMFNSSSDLTEQHSVVSESEDKNRSEDQSGIKKSPGILIDEVETANNSKSEHVNSTEFQVGLVLTKIRKSMSDQTEHSHRVKTRLRTKSENTADNLQKKGLSKLGQRKATTDKVTDALKDWMKKSSIIRLFNKQVCPQSAMIEAKREKVLHPIFKDSKSARSTNQLTPEDIFGKPLKTYSRRSQNETPTRISKGSLSQELTPKKNNEEPQQRRYFLRTNCSHRLFNTEDVCPTCSPEKITAAKKN